MGVYPNVLALHDKTLGTGYSVIKNIVKIKLATFRSPTCETNCEKRHSQPSRRFAQSEIMVNNKA